MLECGVNRGHYYWNGVFMKSDHNSAPMITLKCLHCKYELIKSISELNEKEKEAAIGLGLIPKEKEE